MTPRLPADLQLQRALHLQCLNLLCQDKRFAGPSVCRFDSGLTGLGRAEVYHNKVDPRFARCQTRGQPSIFLKAASTTKPNLSAHWFVPKLDSGVHSPPTFWGHPSAPLHFLTQSLPIPYTYKLGSRGIDVSLDEVRFNQLSMSSPDAPSGLPQGPLPIFIEPPTYFTSPPLQQVEA
ncbi:hypothetical protein CC1G_15354 [Coprinopsis cinerea okayama7|uniref:Uncharacterized protein n=1 Tax=Coprinopsis cinerea (strain Okayama-7 / 130 / ATCC MYA-4618 / FGSC 9003) TaxID=240176 RepID=D6RQ33_COPC7|nr:hypothetical protein CC1G_15354 [Coprinopsis cinerea okayama7\|eukprot:XP_002910447.1 hypothetical protein CC1G_15354 [Coprinopsis cinerea okayama7\